MYLKKVALLKFRQSSFLSFLPLSGMTQEQKPHYQGPESVDTSQIYEKPNAIDVVADVKDAEILGSALHGLSVEEYDKQYLGQQVSDTSSVSSPLTSSSLSTATSSVLTIKPDSPVVELPAFKKPDEVPSLSHISSTITVNNQPHVLTTSPIATTSESNESPVTGFIQPNREDISASIKPSPTRINTVESTVFQINKSSFLKPQHHDIYIGETKKLCYKKIQPHSYDWGFQNTLYRMPLDKGSKKGTVVALTKRHAYQNQMILEWGEAVNNSNSEKDKTEFKNMTVTPLLFVYELEYKSRRLRWARPSLISHNLVCEVVDGQRMIVASFDSHSMGFLVNIGKLKLHNSVMTEIAGDSIDELEAVLVISCCTLIDLLREVVEKAVGLRKGGVAGSV
ncbi:hypothetical protein BGW37DRAFT_474445, partial [Umbelopsis sp. PMI_123]